MPLLLTPPVPPQTKPPAPPLGAPPCAFPVPPEALPASPGSGKIGIGFGGIGAGKPRGAGAGNGGGTIPGESTAPTFIAVNARKEAPTSNMAIKRERVCIPSHRANGMPTTLPARLRGGVETLIQFDGEGTSFWLRQPHRGASQRRHRPVDWSSRGASQDWHHSCKADVHARISKCAIEGEWRSETTSVDWRVQLGRS